MDAQVKALIEQAIGEHEVLLFMKGTRNAPSCGFSARTVELLDALLGNYATVDVLAHADIREGIKEFSSWPTIPQLYVRGKFVGGADIVEQLFESGDLHETLGVPAGDPTPPKIAITDRAAEAFRGFIGDSGELVLLEIDRAFNPQLSIGPKPDKSVVATDQGLDVAMDRLSATRAEGITIDFVETPGGQAFKVDNPNEPKTASVRQLTPKELDAWRKDGKKHRLIDVRTVGEFQTARIDGAELLDADLMEELQQEPTDTVIVFQCHHGHRSQRAAEQLTAQGYTEVYNLSGGIESWSVEVDPAVPRY